MITPVSESPFAVLTLIAAPAVFTNASSVLALGTGNRLARVVDRTRQLVRDLHGTETDAETRELWMRHLSRLEQRGALLVRAMSFFYGAIGCFAAASVVSILGASVVSTQYKWPFEVIVVISFVAGVVGFSGLAVGCSFLVRETRIALRSISEEASLARSWFKR
ncbi:MAG TPA: DUF2721 domain-containing protein [Candidatus Angelobacter sp.]|nr:DUF2721 domain-containing protein [Candidatus Angelobacter sp.]